MKPIIIKPIDIKRFNAFAAHTRSPAAAFISEELGWFANEDETLLAVLLLDTIDNDFVGIILGRDEMGKFCCFDVKASIPSKEETMTWIEGTIKWHSRNNSKVFPQGTKEKPLDLFTNVVPIKNLHPSFVKLQRENIFYLQSISFPK